MKFKNVLLVTALICWAICAVMVADLLAAPYIVCDPQVGVTHYKITGDPYWTADVPSQADGSIKTDVSGIAVGMHSIQVVACNTSPEWGEACSAPAPFTFTRPTGPGVPVNFKLAP